MPRLTSEITTVKSDPSARSERLPFGVSATFSIISSTSEKSSLGYVGGRRSLHDARLVSKSPHSRVTMLGFKRPTCAPSFLEQDQVAPQN